MNHPPASPLRRALLAAGAGLALAPAAAPAVARTTADGLQRKRLILLTLNGGNDGLSTVVPHRDPLYRRLRPTLALDSAGLYPLDDALALHPALGATAAMYGAGELAVVLDVGYPQPNLSHFESAAVWDSADLRGTAASTGWWGRLAMDNRAAFQAAGLDAAAVSFDARAAFAMGEGVPVLYAGQNIADLFEHRRATLPTGAGGAAGALARLLDESTQVRQRVAARLLHAKRPNWQPYERPVDVALRLTDWFLTHGVRAPVLQMAIGGFDTHTSQRPRHDELMHMLDHTLGELRARLRAAGLWNDTVVMVHSEFGRRPAENDHGGTDHGTAGPVLLAGGAVQGGIVGRRAALDDLDAAGNLRHGIDLRRLYASVASNLFALPADPFSTAGHAPLPLRLA
jgi:uncharacterized protein (DUF1501 family)